MSMTEGKKMRDWEMQSWIWIRKEVTLSMREGLGNVELVPDLEGVH